MMTHSLMYNELVLKRYLCVNRNQEHDREYVCEYDVWWFCFLTADQHNKIAFCLRLLFRLLRVE